MNLKEIQLELESEMVSEGAKRYEKELARGLTSVGPGKALLRKALRPMADAIVEACRPKRGRAKRGVKYIREIDPFILADLTMRRVLDCAVKEETLVKTCKAIASAVEWHTKDASLRAASVAIWNKTQTRLAKTQSPEFRRKSIDGTVAGMKRWAVENAPDLATMLDDVKGVQWDIETQLEVGATLVDLFSSSTGFVTTAEVRKTRTQSKVIVRLTEGTEAWLKEQNEYHSVLRPVNLPMVVPPRNWCAMEEGGYLDNSKAGVDFIKTKAKSLEFENHDMSDAFDAVNLIQRTPWRVNLRVWQVMSQAWETGSRIGGVPPRIFEEGARPLQPLPTRLADMTPEQRKEDPAYSTWSLKRRDAHEYNADLRSDVKSFGDLMSVATRFSQFPEFFHPHKLDWRQRTYPISMFLSPQGDQFNRALIEFAEGKRMGDSDNSAAWLAIHGANCFGVDKVSFEERIAWVEENHNDILEAAFDPLGSRFWTAADKPWPFLAFCFEWLAYTITGDDHITHLPVALDGSNSGLQHLSSMLRDSRGAKITCVSPGEQPEDVYQMVADQVERVLKGECELTQGNDEWAEIWYGKVNRKICKQPTMTYTYSATESGMRDQIKHALDALDKTAETGSHLTFTSPLQDNAKAASYLAGIVRSAIAVQMEKAAEGMTFLQGLARVYSKTGLPLRWTTPLGVPVVQYYPKSKAQKKNVFINGQRHELIINIDCESILDKKRSAAGVSPNFVHSMDSTHLLWTVLYCSDEHQLDCFSMIHDSFGTHATECDQLASATREMFVALYDEDRLRNLWLETIDLLGPVSPELIDELPCVPELGTFNIEDVRDSQYFFA